MAFIPQPFTFNRTNRQSLDEYEVFDSIADLDDYIANGARYVGQIVKVRGAGNTPAVYVINEDLTYSPIEGGAPTGNSVIDLAVNPTETTLLETIVRYLPASGNAVIQLFKPNGMGFPDFNILTTSHPTHFVAVKDESVQSLAVTAYQGIPQMDNFQEMPINTISCAQITLPAGFPNGSWTCSLMFAASAGENPIQGTALDAIGEITTAKSSFGYITIHEVKSSARPRIWRAFFPLSHYAPMVMNITQPWSLNWYLLNPAPPAPYTPPSTQVITTQSTIFSNVPTQTVFSSRSLAINRKTVTLSASFTRAENLGNTSVTIATIASGYRPAIAITGEFVAHNNALSNGTMYMNKTTGGVISLVFRPNSGGTYPANTQMDFTVTYLLP